MRVLLVGGSNQGKLEYARTVHLPPQATVWDGGDEIPIERWGGKAINCLHLLVRNLLEQGCDPVAEVLNRVDTLTDWVILCDEIGGGVVPVDAFERQWREETGRLCIELARRADVVERIVCGLPQRVKG